MNPKAATVGKIVSIVIAVIVLVAIGGVLIYGANEPVVNVLDNSIQIKGMYGVTVAFSEIVDVSLLEKSMSEFDVGRRVNGYNGFDVWKGHFQSNSLGETLLFVHKNSSPTIRIERDGAKDIYLSFSDSEQTKLLFNELCSAME
jgi:hypothetical protein